MIRRRALLRLRHLGHDGRKALGQRVREADTRRAETYPISRLSDALQWVAESAEEQAASPATHWCRKALLIIWLAFDAEAGGTEPRVTSLQKLVVDHERDAGQVSMSPREFDRYFESLPFRREWSWHRPDPNSDVADFVRLMRIAERAWTQVATESSRTPAGGCGAAGKSRLPVAAADLVRVTGQPISLSTIKRARRDAKRPLWSEKRRGRVFIDLREVMDRWPRLHLNVHLQAAIKRWFPDEVEDSDPDKA